MCLLATKIRKKPQRFTLGLSRLICLATILSLLDSELTAVVATFATHRVVDVPCATVCALSEGRQSGLVV